MYIVAVFFLLCKEPCVFTCVNPGKLGKFLLPGLSSKLLLLQTRKILRSIMLHHALNFCRLHWKQLFLLKMNSRAKVYASHWPTTLMTQVFCIHYIRLVCLGLWGVFDNHKDLTCMFACACMCALFFCLLLNLFLRLDKSTCL